MSEKEPSEPNSQEEVSWICLLPALFVILFLISAVISIGISHQGA